MSEPLDLAEALAGFAERAEANHRNYVANAVEDLLRPREVSYQIDFRYRANVEVEWWPLENHGADADEQHLIARTRRYNVKYEDREFRLSKITVEVLS